MCLKSGCKRTFILKREKYRIATKIYLLWAVSPKLRCDRIGDFVLVLLTWNPLHDTYLCLETYCGELTTTARQALKARKLTLNRNSLSDLITLSVPHRTSTRIFPLHPSHSSWDKMPHSRQSMRKGLEMYNHMAYVKDAMDL